MATQ
jgi:large subunit ribosomal protein L22e